MFDESKFGTELLILDSANSLYKIYSSPPICLNVRQFLEVFALMLMDLCLLRFSET